MKKIFILLIIIALGAGLYYGLKTNETTKSQAQVFGDISFEYPENYVSLRQNLYSAPSLEETILVMQKTDYESVLNGERSEGEGPASIVFQRFTNPQGLSPRAWVEKNIEYSSYNLVIGEPIDGLVGGQKAFIYQGDGLYATRNAAFSLGDKIYLISGQFIDRDSDLYRDYDKVLNSIQTSN